ncbi:FKBP-type peptidyl-prolyl cis-trans isomerase N-terminal domain-containing protein [Rubritalea marina]|uniref:FKBP-type peptidyl-prolyl cis-trans isomerase N-terminal domain-containing protein n=1 Tax=Rubritalea marina TaxID=361055 RepID=UPI0003693254|nr:FKBP-type peptidyl-prolyl cis-trans isomerase N-terminal domain-containing protein [Rubritalea marina]
MKKTLISTISIGLSALAYAQNPAPQAPAEAPAPIDPAVVKARVSYAIGYQNAFSLASAGLKGSDFDKDAMLNGFLSGLAGEELKFKPEELDAAMQQLKGIVDARDAKLGEANLAKSDAFFTENGKKDGVVTTESGLQYTIIEKGGDKKYEAPAEMQNGMDTQSEFLVNYTGTLLDGTEFDKSPEGQALPLTLQVIPGFGEALKTMPIGAKWKVFIPAKLAYGPQRQSSKIEPNSALIFDIELTEIRKRQMPQGLPFQLPQGALPPGHPGQ